MWKEDLCRFPVEMEKILNYKWWRRKIWYKEQIIKSLKSKTADPDYRCKTGVEFSKEDRKGFRPLKESNYEIALSFIVCNTASIYKIDENVYAIPLAVIWQNIFLYKSFIVANPTEKNEIV